MTSAYAVFGVMGPRSRELLSRLSPDSFDDAEFPFGTSRRCAWACHRAGDADHLRRRARLGALRAHRPCGRRYDDLFERGADLGVRAGYYAIEAMRLEKGYRAFARELTTDTGPVEAGLTFACKLGRPRSTSSAGRRSRRARAPAAARGGSCRSWCGDPAAIPVGW